MEEKRVCLLIHKQNTMLVIMPEKTTFIEKTEEKNCAFRLKAIRTM